MAVALFHKTCAQIQQIDDALWDNPKNFFKSLKLGTQAIQLSSKAMSLDPTLAAANRAFCIAIAAFSLHLWPAELTALPAKLYTCLTNFSNETASKFLLGVGDCITLGYDFIDFGRLADITALTIPFGLSVCISGALVLTSGKRAWDTSYKLHDQELLDRHVEKLNLDLSGVDANRGEITEQTAKYHLMADIAKNIAFVTIGTFLLLSSYGIFTLGVHAMLAIKIVSLVAAVTKIYQASDITLRENVEQSQLATQFA